MKQNYKFIRRLNNFVIWAVFTVYVGESNRRTVDGRSKVDDGADA